MQRSVKGKVPTKHIINWLQKKDSYTLHKSLKRKFQRRQYIVSGIGALWQADLADLSQLSKYNDGYKFILFVIDCFSRKAYATPLKTKGGMEVSSGLKKLITKNAESPSKLMTDKGTEFFNSYFKKTLKEYKIEQYVSNNQEIKASMVERLQRTIKSRLFRYFTHSNNYRYLDVLNDIIKSYNNTTHSAHGVKPSDVNYNNQEEIWQRLYNQRSESEYYRKAKYQLNNKVRISKYSTVFAKGYLPLWTEEVFIIYKVHKTFPPVYSLKDDSGEKLQGTWYEEELQKVDISNDIFKIESIVGKRRLNGKTQYLVKWVGYPPSFNSYVNKSNLLLNYKN